MAGPLPNHFTVGRGDRAWPRRPVLHAGRPGNIDDRYTGADQKCACAKSGSSLVESIMIRRPPRSPKTARLRLFVGGPFGSTSTTKTTPRRQNSSARIKTVTLEQSGPIWAVVKILRGDTKIRFRPIAPGCRVVVPVLLQRRAWIRSGVVHSFVFDSDGPERLHQGAGDHLRRCRYGEESSTATSVSVATRACGPNRRRAAGRPPRGGLWQRAHDLSRPSGPANGFPMRVNFLRRRRPTSATSPPGTTYKLTQANAHGFGDLPKRTPGEELVVARHPRANARWDGLAFSATSARASAVGVKKILAEKPVGAVRFHGATSPLGELASSWLWSPDGPAMDMRHYDIRGTGWTWPTRTGRKAGISPLGVANSTELTFWACTSVPPMRTS